MKKNGFIVRADGRLQTTITDKKTGKRIYFYGTTARELKQKIFDYQTKIDEGPLFTDVSDEWWEEAEPLLAYQSVRGYLRAKKQADEEFEDMYIKDIQPQQITLYLKRLGKQYGSQKTVDKYRLILNLIFKYAIETGYVTYNPCTAAKTPKGLKKAKREAATVEEEEIIKTTEYEWLFPYFAIYTGMRKGEILALQWKDIDFENNLINVYKSVFYKTNGAEIKGTKTEAGTRVVPLLNPLKERLIDKRPKNQNEYVFSDNGSEPLAAKRYETEYRKYQKYTGIKCTAHQLRHSFATIAFENDISPKIVQEILGHKQLSTTMDIYTDFRKSHLKEITDILNEKIR